MHISTVVPQRYFNGVVSGSERDEYLNLLKKHFKRIGLVAFGQLQFIAQDLPKSINDYNWKTLDALLDFTEQNKIEAHYNTVINNKNSFPKWYWDLSQNDKVSFLEQHVRTVLGKYKNRFYTYKLVNEMERDEEINFLGTGQHRIEILSKIFKWAKEECPQARLMINDYGNFYKPDIRKKYIKMINDIQDTGAKIDLVGLQGHMWTFELPNAEDIVAASEQIHKETGLPLHITEFDISYDNSLYGGQKIDPSNEFIDRDNVKYDNWFQYQAEAYLKFTQLCSKQHFIEEITFWGFVDENVKWERPGIGLFDENRFPKPAFKKLHDAGIIKDYE